MADWSLYDHDWPPGQPFDPSCYQGKPPFHAQTPPQYLLPNSHFQPPEYQPPQLQPDQCQPTQYQPLQCPPPQTQMFSPVPSIPPPPVLAQHLSPRNHLPPTPQATPNNKIAPVPRGETPREQRNRAEKQRRDTLNQSITLLASTVPTVLGSNRKVDKTGVLRLTAHFLRSHHYVFGNAIHQWPQNFDSKITQSLLGILKGFLLTVTYKGLIVVVSQNVQEYLGFLELDLLGHSIFQITHPDDMQMLRDQLMPKSILLGPHGELLTPNSPDGIRKLANELASEKRRFVVRFKKSTQRSEPAKYMTCYVEGSLRKSDGACQGKNRCCQMVRRARARADNPYASGNDIVFIGMVRPTSETFMTESSIEAYNMEYRTRHSVDGEIIQCEQRISLVTGYMTHEVHGINAMNFMHRDDVRWVIVALRQMYDQHQTYGESCYRLMTKNGQFIYMRTRGRLDVDEGSRAVRTFVCTNTVVDEEEGRYLTQKMKRKFMLLVNNTDELPPDTPVTDEHTVEVEDPKQLEKVILHLVTNLPSPQPEHCVSPAPDQSSTVPLAIIPPEKGRIKNAIEKIYSIIKKFNNKPNVEMQGPNGEDMDFLPDYNSPTPEYASPPNGFHRQGQAPSISQHFASSMPQNSPRRAFLAKANQSNISMRRRLDGAANYPEDQYASDTQSSHIRYSPGSEKITANSLLTPVTTFQRGFTSSEITTSTPSNRPEIESFEEEQFETPIQKSQPGPSSGSKRTSEDSRGETSMKRRISEFMHPDLQSRPSSPTPDDDENALDERIFEQHFSALDQSSLEKIIDPTFPDFINVDSVEENEEEPEEQPPPY